VATSEGIPHAWQPVHAIVWRITFEIGPLPSLQHDAAIALWHEAGLVVPWNNPRADLERALDCPSSTVLAATRGESLVATAVVGHDGHRGWVYYLAVDPDSQGRGYGRAMMDACERWLADRGVPKLNLMVRVGNEPVLGFYEALGYGRDEVVVMSRRLD
jgi:ribosomal protein S18 acetylase RimI-like enzyme